MPQKYLHIQGRDVPALGFGTWQLNGKACTDAVVDALDIGYRHIDTAQMYENEAEVGKALQQGGLPREQLFVTTKLGMNNLTAERADRSTRESLDKLRLDYVDLLLIHWPSQNVPMSETLAAMNELRERGLVRHVGVSNFTPSQVAEAAHHTTLFANQVEYHPLLSQQTLLDLAQQMGHMLTAYCPLGRGKPLKEPELVRIAEARGKTPGQIALRWLIQQPNVAAIPKAADPRHRRGNFDIFDFELTDDEMRRITALTGDGRLIDPPFAPAWNT